MDEVIVNPTSATGWHANPVDAANLIMSEWDETNYSWDSYHANTWSTEGDTDGSNFTVPFIEYWGANANSLAKKTISTKELEVENGLYSVTAHVRVRAKDGTTATDITLAVNNGDAEDATEGTQVGETQFTLAEVTATGLVQKRKLVIKFDVAEDNNISWLSFKNVKYTKVRDLNPEEVINLATESEIADCNALIADAESKTIGFAEGEYAPYSNVAALTALKAAKETDVDNPIYIDELTAVQTNLENAVWTVNPEEMNAVYNGTFANSVPNATSGKDRDMPGWTMVDGIRMVVGDANEDLALEATNDQKAFFIWGSYNAVYGEQEYYNMPLKEGVYELTFKVTGWRDGDIPTWINAFLTGCTKVGDFVLPTKRINETDGFVTNTVKIVVPSNGDYKLNLTANKHVVFTDICLLRVPVTEIAGTTVAAANGYGTFISEINRAIPTGMKAYSCASVDGQTLTLVEKSSIEANTPYILENTTASDISIAAENGQSLATKDSYTSGLLTGVYATTNVPEGSYILLNGDAGVGFYVVDAHNTYTNVPKVNANRCYLTAPAGTKARAFRFDGDATGIQNIEVADDAAMYNVSGVRVNSNYKGIVIKGGKKYFVK